jgi:hypothetical protein
LRKYARSSVRQNSTARRSDTVLLENDAITAETVLDNTGHAGRKATWVVEEDINAKLPSRVGWDGDVLIELTARVVIGSQCVLDESLVVRIASE